MDIKTTKSTHIKWVYDTDGKTIDFYIVNGEVAWASTGCPSSGLSSDGKVIEALLGSNDLCSELRAAIKATCVEV
jgi:hypothetical protein